MHVKCLCLGLSLVLVSAVSALGAISATATISGSPVSSSFNYTIQLQNTGTTNIGTLWFAWVPGYDFMNVAPTNISVPTGWIGFATGPDFSGDGYGLEIYNLSGSAIGAGSSGTFSFTSTESPSQLMGGISTPPGDVVTTSFVYIGFPESDPGFQFNVQVVPEPTSLVLATIGGLAGLIVWCRQRAAAT